ncbi:hypothetical protein QTP86_032890 [Hemibagrus guttatus]|nr:hypothetical protein QTP86_032890 [Hemibagrus guttatus]
MGDAAGQRPKHRSKSTTEWLQQKKIRLLEWPSQSPDLNLIEMLWHDLKRAIHTRHPKNIAALKQFCKEEWSKIPPDHFTEPLSTVEANTAIVDMWSVTLGAVGAAIAGIILANTDFFLTKPEFATLQYLENADLRTTEGNEKVFKARTLWETSGAVIMAEATELSSLKPQLDKLGVPLYAVVKENIGTEVQDFKPHFAGDVFLDEKQVFYGPMVRKMGGLGFIRLGVWHNFIRAWRSGYQGNMNGEGFILGGVYVIGSGKQGVLLEHREKEFGDKVDYETVLEAAKKIVQK